MAFQLNIEDLLNKRKVESNKITNYPYQAFEEAVVNAFYHRNYQEHEPVEITIEPDRVEILSHAGPDRSISDEAIKQARRLKTRKYRNRRLGVFLKELNLSEGRATGIPTIQKHLKLNGSAPAVIDTDADRTYFLMTIPCRNGFESGADANHPLTLKQELGQMYVQVRRAINQCVITDKDGLEQIFVQVWSKSKGQADILRMMTTTMDTLCILEYKALSANDLNDAIGFGATYELKRKVIIPLIQLGYVTMTNPDKPRSSQQTYKLTETGEKLFKVED